MRIPWGIELGELVHIHIYIYIYVHSEYSTWGMGINKFIYGAGLLAEVEVSGGGDMGLICYAVPSSPQKNKYKFYI